MLYATCIDESCYGDALTYARRYPILALKPDHQPRVIKIQGDNQRVRWYPTSCFDLSGQDVPRIAAVHLHDDLEEANSTMIEVDIELTNGQRRWCWVATPSALALSGEHIPGTQLRVHYAMPHLIIVNMLDHTILRQALEHVERNGALFRSTLPIRAEEPVITEERMQDDEHS